MTKNDEIQALMELAHKLGENSYCGPWLESQIPFIEHDMRCDIIPTASWSETRQLHDSTITLAKDQAERIIRAAKKDAEEITTRAKERLDLTRETLKYDLQRAMNSLA
jgi:hypothetical protein